MVPMYERIWDKTLRTENNNRAEIEKRKDNDWHSIDIIDVKT